MPCRVGGHAPLNPLCVPEICVSDFLLGQGGLEGLGVELQPSDSTGSLASSCFLLLSEL